MTANVTFEVESKSDILVIPAGALVLKDGKSFVRLPKKNAEEKEYPQKQIETGLSDGRIVELLSGLGADEVFLAPRFRLGDGDFSTNPFSPFNRSSKKKKQSK